MKTKAVLITGASGGIGQACMQILRDEGISIFAGVRTQAQVEQMQQEAAHPQIVPVLLDVTNLQQNDDAFHLIETVSKERQWDFVGLVNNAAFEYLGALEILPLEFIRHEMEVGFFGALAVIKRSLPLLRKSSGRIINVSSIHGLMAVPTAGSGCIAKRSLEALSDVLRLELAPWNIKVIVINPGPTATPLWGKTQRTFEQVMSGISPEAIELYYPDWRAVVATSRADTDKIYSTAVQPEMVGKAILLALTAKKPKVRYLVGPETKRLYWLYRLLPTNWLDAFNRHTYNYSA